MISPQVRKALQQLAELTSENAAESAGDCWAEFLDSVIEITRQNAMTETLRPTSAARPRRYFSKDEIIARALRAQDFDLEEFGLTIEGESNGQ